MTLEYEFDRDEFQQGQPYEESMQKVSNFSLVARAAHVHEHYSSRSIFCNFSLCLRAQLPLQLL
jgi:hypothetical protein